MNREPEVGAGRPVNDAEEFERRLTETQRMVFQIAYGVLANAADAEEVAQDVFLRAYRKLGALRDGFKFRAWVGRMSWRLALNRRRALGRSLRRETAWLDSQPAAGAARGEGVQSRLREEIDRLPEKLRAVLILSALEGLEARDVAEILEVPEGTVRSRLHWARRRLLERLSE